MDCEVCGEVILGKGVDVLIDGARLIVCRRCASGATVARAWARSTNTPASKTVEKKILTQSKTLHQASRKRFASRSRVVPEGRELVENYGQQIRKARQEMRVSQEEFSRKIAEKVSVLQKIEAGKLVPEDSLVRKLEHALKIHLVHKVSEKSSAEQKFSPPLELTLGDVAVMQQKKSGEK